MPPPPLCRRCCCCCCSSCRCCSCCCCLLLLLLLLLLPAAAVAAAAAAAAAAYTHPTLASRLPLLVESCARVGGRRMIPGRGLSLAKHHTFLHHYCKFLVGMMSDACGEPERWLNSFQCSSRRSDGAREVSDTARRASHLAFTSHEHGAACKRCAAWKREGGKGQKTAATDQPDE